MPEGTTLTNSVQRLKLRRYVRWIAVVDRRAVRLVRRRPLLAIEKRIACFELLLLDATPRHRVAGAILWIVRIVLHQLPLESLRCTRVTSKVHNGAHVVLGWLVLVIAIDPVRVVAVDIGRRSDIGVGARVLVAAILLRSVILLRIHIRSRILKALSAVIEFDTPVFKFDHALV